MRKASAASPLYTYIYNTINNIYSKKIIYKQNIYIMYIFCIAKITTTIITTMSFSCTICDYQGNTKQAYTRHMKSKKHKNRQDGISVHVCQCGKSYLSRQSLYLHKKDCIIHKTVKKVKGVLGKFHCATCKRVWYSTHTTTNETYQMCKVCETKCDSQLIYYNKEHPPAYLEKILQHMENTQDREHLSLYCQNCREGKPCFARRYHFVFRHLDKTSEKQSQTKQNALDEKMRHDYEQLWLCQQYDK